MADLAMNEYTGTPDELLEQARKVANTPESAALMMAAVHKRLAELKPGEEPYAAAKRLMAERDDWGIEACYRYLNEYYENSLDLKHFSVSYEDIDHEEHIALAETIVWALGDGVV